MTLLTNPNILGEFPSLSVYLKKTLAIFPSPAGMSLTKLSLGGKNFNDSPQVGDIPAGDGKSLIFFTVCACFFSIFYMKTALQKCLHILA
jgi:hypothetical protein